MKESGKNMHDIDIVAKSIISLWTKKGDQDEDNRITELKKLLDQFSEGCSKKVKELENYQSKAKSANKEQLNLLQRIEEIAHIGSWTYNSENNSISYTKEVVRIFENQIPSDPPEMSMDEYYKRVHPDDLDMIKEIFSRPSYDGKPLKAYHRIVLGKIIIKFVEVRAEYDFDKNNRLVGIHGTIQDISELESTKEELTIAKQKLEVKINQKTRDLRRAYMQLEREVNEKEVALGKARQLAAIVESSTDAIIGKKLDGTITSWNKGAEGIFQYTEKEMLGRRVEKLVPKENKADFNRILNQAILGNEPKTYQTQRIRKDSKLIDVSVTVSPIKNVFGDVIGIASITRDITESLKARKRFELAFEAAPNSMILVGDEGEILMINSQTEKMFGYQREELINKRIDVLIPSKYRSKLLKEHKRFQKSSVTEPTKMPDEMLGLKKDGTEFNAEIGLNPFESRDGKYVLASIVDVTERKKFEDRIKESEKRYRTLVETMNEGVLIVDNHDVIQFANDHMCLMTGYDMSELIGQKSHELLLDNDGRKFMKEIFKERKKGKATKYEIQLVTKTGEKIWSLTNGSPIFDKHDKLVGYVALQTNITDRKLIEVELNAIANLPRENPNPTFRFSVKGQVLMYANPASKETLKLFKGPNKDEIRNDWVDHINKAFKSGSAVKKELVVDDKIFLCSIVPVTKKGYVNVYAVDISAAKKAEEENKRYSLILSKTENAVLIANSKGEIQWVNNGFLKTTGYSREEVIGTHGEKLRKGRRTGLNQNHPYFIRLHSQKRSISYESHNYRKNGEEYWTITTLTPILNNLGELDGIIAIDSDITAKKKAESEIIKAKKIAEDLAQSKEMFLANVSHEIRTPMNAISGFVDQIAKGPLNTEQQEQIKMVQKSTSHLLHLINDVLDFSKLQRGKVSLENMSFKTHQVLEDITSFIRPMAEEKHNDLVCEIDDNTPPVLCGDIHRFQQIILNILSNAVKFTNDGSIKISVSPILLKNEEVRLQIIIADTGIGMTPDQLKKIFKEFEQAEVSTSRTYGGTGLGLAITKKLIKLFDGSIEVTSEKNKGTQVKIEIPFNIGKEELVVDIKQEQNIEISFLEGKRILIVDDEPFNRKLLQSMLKDKNVSLMEATNGLEAVEAVEENEFDVVLMDVRMPELNGIEATKRIRKMMDPTKKDVIIIALTAAVTEKDKHTYLLSGMNNFVPKPFKEGELIAALYKTIEQGDGSVAKSNEEEDEIQAMSEMNTSVNFQELQELSGSDTDFYQEMLQTYIDGAKESIIKINSEYENKEWENIPDHAHKISSPTRHIGAEKLYKILKKMEKDGRKNEFDLYGKLMEMYNSEVLNVIRMVEKELSNQKNVA